MSQKGPELKTIPMDPEEVKRLLATGDYDTPESQIVNQSENVRIKALEERVEVLAMQQKNILEHFREMIAVVTEISEESSEE